MILMKLCDEYKLYSHDSCIATTHESPYKKLSLKNCQAIENGYDLDELTQTEWLVKIVMECGEVKQCECSSNENCLNPQPKLDADGCLILKRK